MGFAVGMTGMGGGALLTPVMVLLFGVDPLAAVSSDLVVSLVMKPVGAGVHIRHGTVRGDIARWLCLGSVPAAFLGVLLLKAMGGDDAGTVLKRVLGGALLLAATAIVLRARRQRRAPSTAGTAVAPLRRPATAAVGVIGGLMVGLTSVGSGSLVIVMLLYVYPNLSPSALVGTDLVQAIPLVASAALGHALFGDVRIDLALPLLLGALPGVYLGARVSSRAHERLVRTALVVLLTGSGLKLVGAF